MDAMTFLGFEKQERRARPWMRSNFWLKNGLDGTKIRPDDACAWMLLGEFDGPDSSPGCDVEDIVKSGHRDWGCE
jgi:hypothetical protein